MADAQVLPGQLFLNEQLAPPVPPGMPRPFAPGEYIQNPDGSWSSEISVTVTDPRLNGGAPTVVPSLWLVDNQPVQVSEDQAVGFALQSGLTFPAFPDLKAAETFATQREEQWQGIEPQTAVKIPPLWKQNTLQTPVPSTRALDALRQSPNQSPGLRALEQR